MLSTLPADETGTSRGHLGGSFKLKNNNCKLLNECSSLTNEKDGSFENCTFYLLSNDINEMNK
ncbi:hypothetical protein NQ315_003604 [Exocentrus adspersus]|uniref:CYCLOIDEA-like protein n=1 Tax=Exocentrus adspersus TaxID=1586481 RepID=A0AAV8VJB8_9CUCU|nr:hypothetical protein NQ315_003604 [Exocentrus adspersus]